MRVTEIQRFCMHDGPGLRTTVFLKGCPMRCQWCHNPETQSPDRHIVYIDNKCIRCGVCAAVCPAGAHHIDPEGFRHVFDRSLCTACGRCADACCTGALSDPLRVMSPEEVYREVCRDRAFYGGKGGVTLSGGEPLMQYGDVAELFRLCRDGGIGTAVETCGIFDADILPELVPLTDIFLWDFKDGNDERHMRYTGVSNAAITANLLRADSLGARTVLRCIMINGVNMAEDHYSAIADLWKKLRNCLYVELLPYHAYGGSKSVSLGKDDSGRREWIPDEADIVEVREHLRSLGVTVRE